jgi:Glycosyltransferase family 87
VQLRRAYVVAAPWLALIAIACITPTLWHQVHDKPWDGRQDWWSARLWWDGQDPYSKEGVARINYGFSGHPPTTAFYALPLALFPLEWMSRILGAIVLGLLGTRLFLMARELRWPEPARSAALLFAAVLLTPFMSYHLGLAQDSELIAFGIFLAWYFWRRDREIATGVTLGLTCTLKPFPGLLVLLLLASRRWRGALAAAAVWLAVAALVTARFGFACWREYLVNQETVTNLWIGHASNVTLQGLIVRVLHPACEGDTYSDSRAALIAAGISAVLVGGAFWLSRGCIRRVDRIDLPFALFAVLSMLANAFYWEHYDVILLLPLAIAATALWHAWRTGLDRIWALIAAGLLAVAVVCCQIPPNKARVLLYWARSRPDLHFTAHLHEVLIALPMPLTFLVLASLLAWFRRHDFRGAGELARVPPTRAS